MKRKVLSILISLVSLVAFLSCVSSPPDASPSVGTGGNSNYNGKWIAKDFEFGQWAEGLWHFEISEDQFRCIDDKKNREVAAGFFQVKSGKVIFTTETVLEKKKTDPEYDNVMRVVAAAGMIPKYLLPEAKIISSSVKSKSIEVVYQLFDKKFQSQIDKVEDVELSRAAIEEQYQKESIERKLKEIEDEERASHKSFGEILSGAVADVSSDKDAVFGPPTSSTTAVAAPQSSGPITETGSTEIKQSGSAMNESGVWRFTIGGSWTPQIDPNKAANGPCKLTEISRDAITSLVPNLQITRQYFDDFCGPGMYSHHIFTFKSMLPSGDKRYFWLRIDEGEHEYRNCRPGLRRASIDAGGSTELLIETIDKAQPCSYKVTITVSLRKAEE